MKIVRSLTADDQICIGQQIDDEHAIEIDGKLFGPHRVTDHKLRIEKLLAPLVPTDILCIGLNYREHAAESGSAIPINPMLFIKASNTLNNPLDPIPTPPPRTQAVYQPHRPGGIAKTPQSADPPRPPRPRPGFALP